MPSNGQERRKHQPVPFYTHKHAASSPEYLEPICTNDPPCLMHFLEDEPGAGYSFGSRGGVGEVSG